MGWDIKPLQVPPADGVIGATSPRDTGALLVTTDNSMAVTTCLPGHLSQRSIRAHPINLLEIMAPCLPGRGPGDRFCFEDWRGMESTPSQLDSLIPVRWHRLPSG